VVNCGTVGDVKDETLDIFAPALHRMTAGRHAVALRSFGGSQCRFASADVSNPSKGQRPDRFKQSATEAHFTLVDRYQAGSSRSDPILELCLSKVTDLLMRYGNVHMISTQPSGVACLH
jgi:hypothetical protein